MEEKVPQKPGSYRKSNKFVLYIFIFTIGILYTTIGSGVYYLNFTSLRGLCGFENEYSWWKPEWRLKNASRISKPKEPNAEQIQCIHQSTAIVTSFCSKEEIRNYYTDNIEPLVRARKHRFSIILDRLVEDILDEGKYSKSTNVRDRRDLLLRIMKYQCTETPSSPLILRAEVGSTIQKIIDSMCVPSSTTNECEQTAKEVWLEGENIFATIYDGCSRLSGDQKK